MGNNGIPLRDRNFREKSCHLCGATFKPTTLRQLRCASCMQPTCADCGRPLRGIPLHRLVANRARRCTSCNEASFAGRGSDGRGYVIVRTSRGWEPEHRVVMERKIGRALLRTEVVHHLDENRANNDPDNLVLCEGVREHLETYHRGALVPPPVHHNGRRRKDGTMPTGLTYRKRTAVAAAQEEGL